MKDFAVARNDSSILGRWWWSIDRAQLVALAILILSGCVLITAASPPVAERIGVDGYHFIKRHLFFLAPTVLTIFIVSLLNPRGIRRLGALTYVGAYIAVCLTLIIGSEIKGATRWISLFGFSLQPTEFLKPAFAVVSGWMFAWQPPNAGGFQVTSVNGQKRTIPSIASEQYNRFRNIPFCVGLLLLTISPVLMQPDLGMTIVLCAIWAGQLFLAGISMFWIILLVALGAAGLVAAYFLLPHVQDRINKFLFPENTDTYQVDKSIEAFENGGYMGVGVGEGTVKNTIPDAHADFVFAVAGEEYGAIACLALLCIFAFVVLRGFGRSMSQRNLFVMLASTGLLIQFGGQAVINMASTLSLMPTKGMTLPFISYGGSSMVALGLGMGMMLALTRRLRAK